MPTLDPKVRAASTMLSPAVARLAARVDPLTARVRVPELTWLVAQGAERDQEVALADACAAAIRTADDARIAVRSRADALRMSVEHAGPVARREAFARHIRVTVPAAGARRKDLAALSRNLDLAALLEREAALIETEGARIEVATMVMQSTGEAARHGAALRGWLAQERRPATRRALTAAVATIGDPESRALLRRLVFDLEEDVWVRRRALAAEPGWAPEVLQLRRGADDDLVRAEAARILAWSAPMVAARALQDRAEVVRAVTIDALADAGHVDVLRRAGMDGPPRMRARVAARLGGLGERGVAELAPLLRDEALVASFACDAALQAILSGVHLPASALAALHERTDDDDPTLARRAALVLTAAEMMDHPVWDTALRLRDLPPGERWTGTLHEAPEDLARALTVFAASGFGYWLDRSGRTVTVTRGDEDTPALWRILHELRNPGPSKRQGHTHAVGRADRGALRVPPALLAEESATGVPGQRVRIGREGGWAPAVPMVDDFLDAAWRGEVRIVTPEGITTVSAPVGPRRVLAYIQIVLRYAELDTLRSAALADPDPALRRRFLDELGRLGFVATLGAASVQRTRSPSLPAFAAGVIPITWLAALDPVSAIHLMLVTIALSAFLFGRAAVAKRRVRRARARIPLVVGGWGTRGKSGTERLKAAAFEGLGVPMLSKTTGCEAMVLHAPPGGRAVELFLFRPFDKATIWEQTRVVDLGARLGVRTFLWECMGLNPTYVSLLQHSWMRDDLSTLTNAYPDHEDIQGPTGMDVATVLGGFAPPDGVLYTTEENMLPVLEHEGRRRGCTVRPVGRVERELMPKELLDRMPHAEHPANVALAAAALRAMGVEPIEAIGLMAEHVVPDLGALIVYPRATHEGRDVVFANGMSANDTLSFKHNWRRVGFASHDHHQTPDEWLVTVVNNRADRVARTRVFASIVANDANAHRHVFIGTNLEGLRQYLGEAVAQKLRGVVLDGDPARVDALFDHLRIVDPVTLSAACRLRLGLDPDDLGSRLRQWTPTGETLDALRTAAAAAVGPGDHPELHAHIVEAVARWGLWRAVRAASPEVVRAAYTQLVWASVVVVEDAGASGDTVMATAIKSVPPGAVARIMGIQNIKGTGLDFAYQWVFWRQLHRALQLLPDPARRGAALDQIEQNPLGSALACEAALEALGGLERDTRVACVIARVETRLAEVRAARGKARRKQGWLVRTVERWIDPIDSVLRARRAEIVFDDLAEMRIDHGAAQLELQRLTERQKGGWLRVP